MLEDRIQNLLKRHNISLSESLKSELSVILSKENETIDVSDESSIETSSQISSKDTWSPIDDAISTATTIFLGEFDELFGLESECIPSIGHYDDLGTLGHGGMGEVRRVRDPILNRTLAMKILHPHLLEKQDVTSRFIEEAQVCAQLQHPNIVPIHEMGRLDDGRVYFTMKEIKGRPFGDAIADVHAAIENNRWQITGSGWSLRRLIDAFHDVCRAVSFAHSKGVLHRDLKPENIMLGEYGEVLVVDWGIAKVLGRPDLAALSGDLEVVYTDRFDMRANSTRFGQVAGTPAYMSPEQARGEIDKLDGRTDIYALGAILYEILIGHPPYVGQSGLDILNQVILGPPQSIRTTNTTIYSGDTVFEDVDFKASVKDCTLPIPDELVEICERAMQRQISARYSSVQELAEAISDWLDGSKKREQALKIVEEALDLTVQRELLEIEATELLDEAKQGLKQIPSWETEDVKGEWWEREHRAKMLQTQSQMLDIEQEQKLQGALTHKADLEEAHIALAERYRVEHEQAEIERDTHRITQSEVRLREHATALPEQHLIRIEHLQYLKGTGAVSLMTDVEGVEVLLEQYVPHHRRLIPKLIANLGEVPISSYSLEMGSYRLRLRKKGHHEVFYPVYIGRGEHWDGVDPNGFQQPIVIPKLGTLEADDCYVPSGWFWAGGDKDSPQSFERKRIWVDAFIMKKFPVTNREYLVFLNDLLKQGREKDALKWVPRERAGQSGQTGSMIYGRGAHGEFILVPDADGDVWNLDWPVCMVDWHCAKAFADWKSQLSGHPWRLLHEIEWEKGARGTDGRFFVWGDEFDASYACTAQSHQGRMLPACVDSFPIDESVYGVRGLAGNMMDWTGSAWSESWDESSVCNDRLFLDNMDENTDISRVDRGGSWSIISRRSRASVRNSNIPSIRWYYLGFRLGRSL